MPETNNANAGTSDHAGRSIFPRASASSTAPAASAACAQIECASRCIVEKVEKIVITFDKLGSAPGSVVVLNSDGKGARELIGDDKSPVRWFVIGIVDE